MTFQIRASQKVIHEMFTIIWFFEKVLTSALKQKNGIFLLSHHLYINLWQWLPQTYPSSIEK